MERESPGFSGEKFGRALACKQQQLLNICEWGNGVEEDNSTLGSPQQLRILSVGFHVLLGLIRVTRLTYLACCRQLNKYFCSKVRTVHGQTPNIRSPLSGSYIAKALRECPPSHHRPRGPRSSSSANPCRKKGHSTCLIRFSVAVVMQELVEAMVPIS
jgi:hypothetical protein